MAWGASKICATPGCPGIAPPGQSRCDTCKTTANRARGSAARRGYGQRHRTKFRAKVLKRDKVCVLCQRRPATEADHHPRSRDELVRLGLDPDDPQHGRGLCHKCHASETAKSQPGGWHVA